MWKYFVNIVLKLGLYIIYKIPQIYYVYWKRNKYSEEYKYNFIRKIMFKVNKAFNVEYHVEGLENIPSNQTYVLFPNHQANFDPLALVTVIDKPIQFIGKKEVQKMFLVGKAFEILNSIYLDRDNLRASLDTMKECQRRIKEDHANFVIFPEGTRTRKEDRRMNDFKPGAFKSACNGQATIVPVMLNGTYRVLNKKIKKKVYRVDIKFLKPIPYEEYKDISTADLALHVHNLVEEELEKSFISNPSE